MKILQPLDPNMDTDAVTHLCPSVLNYVARESDEVYPEYVPWIIKFGLLGCEHTAQNT